MGGNRSRSRSKKLMTRFPSRLLLRLLSARTVGGPFGTGTCSAIRQGGNFEGDSRGPGKDGRRDGFAEGLVGRAVGFGCFGYVQIRSRQSLQFGHWREAGLDRPGGCVSFWVLRLLDELKGGVRRLPQTLAGRGRVEVLDERVEGDEYAGDVVDGSAEQSGSHNPGDGVATATVDAANISGAIESYPSLVNDLLVGQLVIHAIGYAAGDTIVQPRKMKSCSGASAKEETVGSATTTLLFPLYFGSLAFKSPNVLDTDSFPGYTRKGLLAFTGELCGSFDRCPGPELLLLRLFTERAYW
jgi:hypothetical protein